MTAALLSLALSAAPAAAAKPWKACAAGEAEACDEMRSRSALRWARGVVGYGPQEDWRFTEIQILGPQLANRCAAGDRAACVEQVGEELTACVLDEACAPFEPGEPDPRTEAVPVEVSSRARRSQTIAITDQLRVHGSPDDDAEVWMTVAEIGPPVWTAELGVDESVEVPASLLDALARPRLHGRDLEATTGLRVEGASDCGWQVLLPNGAPAGGVWVYGQQLQRADENGVVQDCAGLLVAVHGDAAAVHRRQTVRMGDDWQLQLEPGLRARCRLDGADPVWCDELPREHVPDGRTTFVGVDAEGVFELEREARVWGTTLPRSPFIQHFAGMAPDRASSPFGPVCAVDGWWRPCESSDVLRVRDVEGRPVAAVFVQGGTDVSGRLAVAPGADLLPAEPMRLERKGRRIRVLPSQPASDPRRPPDEEAWRALDFGERTRQVLELAPLIDAGPLADAEIEPFVGGALVRLGGVDMVVAFADAHTAVVRSPRVERGIAVVTLPEAK